MSWADMLDFIVAMADKLYDAFQEIYYFMTLPVAQNVVRIMPEIENPNLFQRGLLDILSNVVGVLNFFMPYTIFELMFGIGLPFVIAWTLVSWVIDILP